MLNRESIFVSTVRSLCKTFGVITGAFVALVVVLLTLSFFSPSDLLPPKSEMTIAPDADGSRRMLSFDSPAVLKINIQGVIGMNDLTGDAFKDILYDSREDLLAKRVQAILLYIDTPGGSAIDSEAIYHALKEYKKKYGVPVYAFVEGLCASGGMYIACAADKVYATSGSIIGSVGVRLGSAFFNFTDLMKIVGVKALTISEGKDKDMLNPYRPWREGEDSSLVNITKESYDQFVSVVSENRPLLDKEKLVNVYGAQVYLAPTAEKLGYIDFANADYEEAVKQLVAASSIGDKPYQVVELKRPRSLIATLTQSAPKLFSGTVRHELELGPQARPEFHGKLLYLYQP